MTPDGPPILVVMGVSGSGKTTVATSLAQRLGWAFLEGDALHSEESVAKMAGGHALTDADRTPWLAAVAHWIDARIEAGEPGVVTCSALRRRYRDVLRRPQVTFVLLDVPEAELRRRLEHRHHHFMGPALLDSQLATLERPGEDEQAEIIDAEGPSEEQVDEIARRLGLGAELHTADE